MHKKLFIIAVLCTTLMGIFLINASALFTSFTIWGLGGLNPLYIKFQLKGGAPPSPDALIDTYIQVLRGDLVLRGPAGQLVLGGVGFSEPSHVSSPPATIEPDGNGNYILTQYLPRRPADCDWEWPLGSGNILHLCPEVAGLDQEQRFLLFWGIDPEDLKNNYSSIEEIRIELGEARSRFQGDDVKGDIFEVEKRFKACLDLRADEWPGDFEYILMDEGYPFACDDDYVTAKTLKISAPGVLINDFDVEGDVLAVVDVNGIPIYPGFETTTDHGTLKLYENGRFIYTPDSNYTGDDSFSYVNADSNGNLSNEAIVTITVVTK